MKMNVGNVADPELVGANPNKITNNMRIPFKSVFR